MDDDLPTGKMKTCLWTKDLYHFNHAKLGVQFKLIIGLVFLSENRHLKTSEINPIHGKTLNC